MSHLKQNNNFQEVETGFKEILEKLWMRKSFILIFTILVLLLSSIYVFTKTPIYEAKSLIEIGDYKPYYEKVESTGDRIKIDNANELSTRLNSLFIDSLKNDTSRQSKIISIKASNRQNFITVVSNAINNDLAEKEILKVFSYIFKIHGALIEDIKAQRQLQLDIINSRIRNIEQHKLKILDKEISSQTETINNLKNQIALLDENINETEKTEPSFATLKLMQKIAATTAVLEPSEKLLWNKTRRNEILSKDLGELKVSKNYITGLLLPHNYKNTQVVGGVLTSVDPIKPRKTLTIITGGLIGFIISILVVLLIDYFKKDQN